MTSLTLHDSSSSSAPIYPYPNQYRSVPPNGKLCPISGLGHAKLYQDLTNGRMRDSVRVVHLKEPGRSRGKLLFHVGDMLRFFDRLAAERGKRPTHLNDAQMQAQRVPV